MTEGWIPWHGGPRPDTGGKPLRVRLRRDTREEAYRREPQLPTWWECWTHSGSGGDIIEIQET